LEHFEPSNDTKSLNKLDYEKFEINTEILNYNIAEQGVFKDLIIDKFVLNFNGRINLIKDSFEETSIKNLEFMNLQSDSINIDEITNELQYLNYLAGCIFSPTF
jgi:hypothetical protein